MTNAYFYSNIAAAAQLNGGINSVATSCIVDTTAGWPVTYPFVIALDYQGVSEELVRVDNNVANTLTIVRAFGGTSATSHGAGAVVRHVYNAVDSTDFRTHEQATSAVHGVSGAIVGDIDTQTLTNKTLTTPIITTPTLASGGSMAGTYTGTPTFSGGVTFSGTPAITNGADLAGTFTNNPTFSGSVGFTGAVQVTGQSILVERTLTTDSAYRSRITGDSSSRLVQNAAGQLAWGPGNATQDTNLYRNSVGELKTDTAMTIVGALAAGNLTLGAWSTYTPVWTTTTGSHSPSFGNATITATYARLGRILAYSIGITFGSTTNFGAGATTADNWAFSLPAGLTASARFTPAQAICGHGRATQSTALTSPLVVVVDSGGTNFTPSTSGGRQDGNALTNSGTVDSLTPWTWGSGDSIQFSGFVETTT